jgi:hypothetical protein
MSEGGGLVKDVGVPQQGDDEEVVKDKDKECHDIHDSEETEGRHDDRQRKAEGRHDDRQRKAEQVGCEQCGQWGDFTSGQSEDCPFYSLGSVRVGHRVY